MLERPSNGSKDMQKTLVIAKQMPLRMLEEKVTLNLKRMRNNGKTITLPYTTGARLQAPEAKLNTCIASY